MGLQQQRQKQRSVTMAESPIRSPRIASGYAGTMVSPIPVGECTERVERLVQIVQQKHREYMAHKDLVSPGPRTPTRLDEPQFSTVQSSAASTATTASIRSDGPEGALDKEVFSPRRRAVTMDPNIGLGGERGVAFEEPAPLSPKQISPVDEIRAKIERIRARRAAKLDEERARPLSPASSADSSGRRVAPMSRKHSEISGTTYYTSDEANDDEWGPDADDFFENRDNLMLFREVDIPVKDLDWDKRVFYHHVSRTNEEHRRATEDVEIADYREECLAELLGRRNAANIVRANGQKPRRRDGLDGILEGIPEADGVALNEPRQEEVDAMSKWWVENASDEDEDADHSFDWSRDGFGYMEFRRQSRSSAAASRSSIMSPPASAGPTMRRRTIMPQRPPILLEDSAEDNCSGPCIPSMDDTAPAPLITSADTRAAMAQFHEAVSVFGPAHGKQAGQDTTRVSFGMSDSDDGDWQMVGSKEEPAHYMTAAEEDAYNRSWLSELRSDNQELEMKLKMTREVIDALTRMAVRAP
ncbi:hypothetical protein GGF46_004549 [Coemansia sp. RSA 552]|nr:hypothetical protein GGF46_004549 [Coemansia sp. RSA 552]